MGVCRKCEGHQVHSIMDTQHKHECPYQVPQPCPCQSCKAVDQLRSATRKYYKGRSKKAQKKREEQRTAEIASANILRYAPEPVPGQQVAAPKLVPVLDLADDDDEGQGTAGGAICREYSIVTESIPLQGLQSCKVCRRNNVSSDHPGSACPYRRHRRHSRQPDVTPRHAGGGTWARQSHHAAAVAAAAPTADSGGLRRLLQDPHSSVSAGAEAERYNSRQHAIQARYREALHQAAAGRPNVIERAPGRGADLALAQAAVEEPYFEQPYSEPVEQPNFEQAAGEEPYFEQPYYEQVEQPNFEHAAVENTNSGQDVVEEHHFEKAADLLVQPSLDVALQRLCIECSAPHTSEAELQDHVDTVHMQLVPLVRLTHIFDLMHEAKKEALAVMRQSSTPSPASEGTTADAS